MHPNPAFRQEPRDRNIAFARERGFGTLAINGPEMPLTAHIPFLLDKDGAFAELHLVRSNPIVQAMDEARPVVVTVLGPDSYVSPDWYGVPDQVPTWNYVSVRITGQLSRVPQDDLHAMLDRLSAHFEAELAPKPQWSSQKMSLGVMERMMRAIVPLRIEVSEITGTWKLNQNKPLDVRESAADHVRTFGLGNEVRMLSALMRGVYEESKT